MSFQNWVLDAAYLGNPDLEDEEIQAFEDGRNMAYLTIAIHAIAILKSEGLGDMAAEILDIKHHRYEDVFREVKKTKPMALDFAETDPHIAKTSYARTMSIFHAVLTADPALDN